ncbi:hypothetical protein [Cupriavidus taiwanensis]|uniref:hypothetical protein n=1 Tax=Cupriavidus taiwanensis TaxID=164546 RepID=UPI0018DC96E1|nr:hypothetical protein [Cupriavidus taiwanensis]
MANILVSMAAIGLFLTWAIAGLLLLVLAPIAWAVKTMQRGLRWIQNMGEA